MKNIAEMNITELRARAAEIREAVKAEDADLPALEKEADAIAERIKQYDIEQRRKAIAARVADGSEGTPLPNPTADNTAEQRANAFKETRRETISAMETRATLMSSGNLAAPTGVSGINDSVGVKVSSIIDMVKVVNCEGMGSNKIAYLSEDADAAEGQTEGSAATPKEPTFSTITISPESVAVLSYISKQAKKQTPLLYEAKVREQALLSLRKKAASLVTKQLKASKLNTSVQADVASNKGVINAGTLRKIALAYGGDESVVGGAVLFLNKTDLIAFGDVRGTNEKKPVYEITPDASNPNTGTIKDGGLTVRYCLNSNLTALNGTAQTTGTAQKTMFYGVPTCIELDLFSDYEIAISEDFAFDKLMDTIRGDVELGADVVVKNGFVAVELPAKAG